MSKIYLNIIWNYKQPYVKDTYGNYLMPVIRQYMQRDYIDMIKIVDQYPRVKSTFNIVPSLLDQILDYVDNNATDYALLMSKKIAEELTQSDKEFILEHFFRGVDAVIIEPYERYNEIYLKRIGLLEKEYINTLTPYFSDQDYRDMQVWYHLAWIGKYSQQNPIISKLIKKMRNFSEDDKVELFGFLEKFYSSGIELYKEALENKNIELSTSPYFYPNIPLSMDNHAVHLKGHLPIQRINGLDFIKKQLLHSRRYMKGIFGFSNLGIISPEMSVTNSSLDLLGKLRFDWTVINESHLSSNNFSDKFYIQEYSLNHTHKIKCFINNESLSNKIRFEYSKMDVKVAVQNFISEIEDIHSKLENNQNEDEPIVTLFLPGDKIWDEYERNGLEFLNELYYRISNHPDIETIRPLDYISQVKQTHTINKIVETSEKNAFDRWIGNPSANRAWDRLAETIQFYQKVEQEGQFSEKVLKKVRKHIHIAMSTDWFEWYSNQNSKWDIYYDELFRTHLIRCYELLFVKPNISLFFNLKNESSHIFKSLSSSRNIYPQIDGYETDFEEWEGAAIYDADKHRINIGNHLEGFIELLYIGYNETHVCLRVTFSKIPAITTIFEIDISHVNQQTFVIKPLIDECSSYLSVDDNRRKIDNNVDFELNETLEILIPIEDIDLKPDQYFSLQVSLRKKDKFIERFPQTSYIRTKYELIT